MQTVSRRRLLIAGGAITGALTLRARGASAAGPLRVGLPAVYTPYAALQYASDQKYFGNTPIEVTVFRGGSAAQETLAAGATDVISLGPPTVALAAAKGVGEKIIALSGPPTPQGWYLVVPANSKIRDMKDLAGANIGITAKGSTTDFLAAWSVKAAGISANLIPLGAGILPALNAGQIQAGIIWPLPSFKAIESGEVRALQNYGDLLKDATFDVWVASDAALKSRRDDIKVLLRGIGKAIGELQANEALALKVLEKYHGESDPASLKQAYEKLLRTMRPDNAVDARIIDGSLELAAIAGVAGLPKASAITDLSLL